MNRWNGRYRKARCMLPTATSKKSEQILRGIVYHLKCMSSIYSSDNSPVYRRMRRMDKSCNCERWNNDRGIPSSRWSAYARQPNYPCLQAEPCLSFFSFNYRSCNQTSEDARVTSDSESLPVQLSSVACQLTSIATLAKNLQESNASAVAFSRGVIPSSTCMCWHEGNSTTCTAGGALVRRVLNGRAT